MRAVGGRYLVLTLAAVAACDPPNRPPASPSPSAPAASAPASAPASASASATAVASGSPSPSSKQPFVVAIVVDQLSAWVAASRWPALPQHGGFARLRREGTWVKNMRYAHAVTDTAPGHASLHTGKTPSESGIFGNEIPDASGRRVTILRDESTRAVLADGTRDVVGSSAARLRVETVADRLRAARPDALVISVSVKDRGAILPAGRRPTHVLWYDSWLDSFVTSTAFAKEYPTWARGIGDGGAVAAARAKPWEPSDAAWVKAHAATPDAQPGEGDLDGMGTTFPHAIKSGNAFRAAPAGDAMIVDLALAGIAAEWVPTRPTLLLLSMSASDVIGHTFGPDSWEAWDHLYKLDATLARLLDALEKRVGAPVVMLSADHGNLSMPEVDPQRAGVACLPVEGGAPPPPDAYGRRCTRGVRLGPNAMRDELTAAARAALGEGAWIAGFADPYAFLTPAARALPPGRRAILDKAVRATFTKHKQGIADVYDVKTLAERCPSVLASARGAPDRARAIPSDDVLTLVCRAWAPDVGAGDYYVVTRPGCFFDGEIVVGKGTSHGTPYLYDRTVPMLVRAPGLVDAGAVIDDAVDFSVFAALEAAFVGLDTRAPRDILDAHRAR